MKFSTLAIRETTLQAVDQMGIVEMTPIQERAIPVLLEGKDVIGRSQTGTGKTLAFAVPAVTAIDEAERHPQVLVLLPTRELAIQVAGEFDKLIVFDDALSVALLYGGERFDRQLAALRGGAQIVVGTPGRTLDHLRRGTLKLDHLKIAVLDEADEMLDMGFRDDIEGILSQIGHPVQTALFSATMPKPILELAGRFQRDPVKIEVAPKRIVASGIDQKVFVVKKGMKLEALMRLLEVFEMQKALIFCNTKRAVDTVAMQLIDQGYPVSKLHGDIDQSARQAVLRRFTRSKHGALVATDVAARGIDIDDIDLVINYDVPENAEDYVHRIGRTGRAGRKGTSLTLAQNRDRFHLEKIEAYTKKKMTREPIPTGSEIQVLKSCQMTEKLAAACEDMRTNPEGSAADSIYSGILAALRDKGFSDDQIATALLRQCMPITDYAETDLNDQIKTVGAGKKGGGRKSRKGRGHRDPQSGVRIMISAGKKDGAKKGDILGAICGESGISSDEVGDIAVFGHFSTAVVADDQVAKVIAGLDGARIKRTVVSASIAGKKKDKKKKGHHARKGQHHGKKKKVEKKKSK